MPIEIIQELQELMVGCYQSLWPKEDWCQTPSELDLRQSHKRIRDRLMQLA